MNKNFFFYFSVTMCILYIAFAIYIMFIDKALTISPGMRYFFGTALAIYGIFRAIRSYQLVKRKF